MPAFNLESAVKSAFESGMDHDSIKGEVILTKGKIPFGEVETKFKELGLKLGFILSKEDQEKLVKEAIKKASSASTLPTGYLGAVEFINDLSLKALNDVTKIVKANWVGDFPKKELYEWPTEGHYGKILQVIVDNPNLSIEEFKAEKLKITAKGNYDLDIIKFAKGFQKMSEDEFYNLFKK